MLVTVALANLLPACALSSGQRRSAFKSPLEIAGPLDPG
jgi:hypothetical protein